PVGGRGGADTSVVGGAIAAHVGVQVKARGREPLSRNVLVYFPNWDSDKPLGSLTAALPKVRNSSALMVIVVLPGGAFDASRRNVESKIGSSGEHQALVQFTEDDEGGWTSMFAVKKRPSAYLINARRQVVWK